MLSLDQLLKESKEIARRKPVRRKAKTTKSPGTNIARATPVPVNRVVNPWADEAIVLISLRTTCRGCGCISEAAEPSLFLLRSQYRYRSGLEQHYTRVSAHAAEAVYGTLERRKQAREYTVDYCQECFSVQAPRQQALPLQQPLELS